MVQCRRDQRDETMLNEAPRAGDVCGSGGMGAVIPNLDSRWNRMVTFMSCSPYPTKEEPSILSGQEGVTSEARVWSPASPCGVFGRLTCTAKGKGKGEGKLHPRTGYEGPEGVGV